MFGSGGDGEAKVRYGDGEYTVLVAGSHVRCAASGKRIPLEELRYWSVAHQEPYASAELATQRHKERGAKA